MFRFLINILVPPLAFLWIISWVTEDRFPVLSLLSFIPALPAFIAVVLWWIIPRQHGWLTGMMMIALIGGGIKLFVFDMRWNSPADLSQHPEAIKMVHWNVARFPFGAAPIYDRLEEEAADIIVLSEVGGKKHIDKLKGLLGEDSFMESTWHLSLLSKWPIKLKDRFTPLYGQGVVFQVEHPIEPINIIIIDFFSHFNYSREQPINDIHQAIQRTGFEDPLIVVGDFNTPRNCVFFDHLRAHLTHPYEAVGRGLPYTWPAYLPFLGVDHMWVSDHFIPLDYKTKSHWRSDHLMQVFYTEFK